MGNAKQKTKKAPLPLQQPPPRASGVKRLVLELLYLYLVSTCCSALFSVVHHLTGLDRPIVLWGCAEVAFFLYHRWRVYQMHANEEPHQFVVKDDNHFRDFLSLSTCIEFQDFITGWFFHKDYSDIKRGNVFDFIAYGFLYKRRADLTPEEAQQVHRYVRATEDAWGLRFKDGYNTELDFMAHLFQPLQVLHKPLALHLVMELFGFATHLVLWMWGFHHHYYRGVSFWVADKIAVCGLPLLMPPVSPLHSSAIPDTTLTGTPLKPPKGSKAPPSTLKEDAGTLAEGASGSGSGQAAVVDTAADRGASGSSGRGAKAAVRLAVSSSMLGGGGASAVRLRKRSNAAAPQQQQADACVCCSGKAGCRAAASEASASGSGGGGGAGSKRAAAGRQVGWQQDQQLLDGRLPSASARQGGQARRLAGQAAAAPAPLRRCRSQSAGSLMDLCSGSLPSWPSAASLGLDFDFDFDFTLPELPSLPISLPELPTLSLPSLPQMPAFPAMPSLPQMPAFPPMPSLPQMPGLPSFPDLPSLPNLNLDLASLAWPQIPDLIPALPALPSLPDLPSLPSLPTLLRASHSASDLASLAHIPTLPLLRALTLGPAPTPRPPPPDALPIVFLHGVGLGVFPYLLFLRRLMAANPDTPVLLLEVRQVALRYTHTAEDFDSIAAAVIDTLRAHGYTQACFVAHSYGTFVSARICHMFPHHVHSVALIDPVCMLLCYPKTLHNFIYAPPALSHLLRHPGRALVDLLRWYCARDAGVAHTFCRRFFWHTLSLWPRQMPPKAVVALAGLDDLVPSDHIRAYLRRWAPSMKVLYKPRQLHGTFLLSPAYQQEIVDSITQMLRS